MYAPDDQLALSVAEGPAVDDVVVAAGDARIYMPDNVAGALDEKVLDAEVTEEGAVRFSINDQR